MSKFTIQLDEFMPGTWPAPAKAAINAACEEVALAMLDDDAAESRGHMVKGSVTVKIDFEMNKDPNLPEEVLTGTFTVSKKEPGKRPIAAALSYDSRSNSIFIQAPRESEADDHDNATISFPTK